MLAMLVGIQKLVLMLIILIHNGRSFLTLLVLLKVNWKMKKLPSLFMILSNLMEESKKLLRS